MRCVHHWVIETPNGMPTSRGECRKCGETREFVNSGAEYERYQVGSSRGGRGIEL